MVLLMPGHVQVSVCNLFGSQGFWANNTQVSDYRAVISQKSSISAVLWLCFEPWWLPATSWRPAKHFASSEVQVTWAWSQCQQRFWFTCKEPRHVKQAGWHLSLPLLTYPWQVGVGWFEVHAWHPAWMKCCNQYWLQNRAKTREFAAAAAAACMMFCNMNRDMDNLWKISCS